MVKILGKGTKAGGLCAYPGQVDEVAVRFPQIGRYQVGVTRREHKEEMTFLIELKGENDPSDKPKERIERSIRDVMKIRGEAEFVSKGTIPDGVKKIEDQRTWE